jgi:hypothetical protein
MVNISPRSGTDETSLFSFSWRILLAACSSAKSSGALCSGAERPRETVPLLPQELLGPREFNKELMVYRTEARPRYKTEVTGQTRMSALCFVHHVHVF